jgi:hypothetical protein
MIATKREQQPFVYGSLSKEAIYLKPLPPSIGPKVPAPSEVIAPRKPVFEKALSVILATVAPQKSARREQIIARYEDGKANKGLAIELLSGKTWRSTDNEDQAVTGDRTLEGCQLRFGHPCALIVVNEEIVTADALAKKDMPRIHYSGKYDPQEIPIVRSAIRELSKVQDYGKMNEPKAMAIHPWGQVFVSQEGASLQQAEQTALDECNNNTRLDGNDGNCFLYASNNDVVISKRLMSPTGIAPPSCQVNQFKIRIGETNTANWTVVNGGVCIAHFKLAETSHYNSLTISSEPAHGFAGANGVNGITYRPEPGFKGTDAFAFRVEGHSKGKPGEGTGVVRVGDDL